jgi:hypothetical protein
MACLVASGTLHAQVKIYVASYGNDANDGSRGSPKRNFQAAHDGLAVGGEIVALDTAGYGTVTITKALTITSPPGVTGLISVSGAGGTGITISVGAGATVALRGLTIENVGSASTGINFNLVGTLNLSDCTIQGFTYTGLLFNPSGNAGLLASRCAFRNSGSYAAYLSPTGGTTNANFDGCQFESSSVGLLTTTSGTAAVKVAARHCAMTGNNRGFEGDSTVRAVLHDCLLANNTELGAIVFQASVMNLQECAVFNNSIGVSVQGNGATGYAQNCTICDNGTGVKASGTSAIMRVDGCVVTGNTSFGFQEANSGNILSRANNTLTENSTNTAFGTYTGQ